MKRYVWGILLLWGWSLGTVAQVQFTEVKTLEEMQEMRQKASDQELMMFVDVYATWCGPCKLMDQQVYTDPKVAEYMNAHFVSVRLDGESEYGRMYAAEQQLQGYPSMFIFSREGEPVSKVIGFTPAEELVSTLETTVENYKVIRKYRAEYERGTLDDEGLAEYITVARNMGNQEEAEMLAGQYMERVMDEKLSDRDIGVVAFYMDLADTWWPSFSSDPDRLKKVLGDDYMLALEKIYNNTLVKAINEENIQLISKMANELAPLVDEAETSSWDLRSQPFLQYYYYTDQIENLIKYVDERIQSDRKGDHAWLYGAASQITDMDQQYRTEALLKKEAEWFQLCIDLEPQFDYYFYHGMVLYLLKDQEEAKTSFLEAEKLASTTEQQEMISQVLSFVNRGN
ncbi:MAG: thioredoxin family protein [Bacteroidales bacterium]